MQIEIEHNAYAKFWRNNKEYYGIFKNAYWKESSIITADFCLFQKMYFAHRGRILYKLFQLMGTSTKWYIKLTVRLMPWVDRFKCTLHNGNFLPVGFKVVQNFTTAMSLSLFGRTLNSVLNSKSSSNLLRHKFKTSNKYKRNSVLHKLTLKHCKNYRSDLKCFRTRSFIIWLSLFSPCDWSICGP